MDQSRSCLMVLALPAFVGLGLSTASLHAAAPPTVRELRIQQVGEVTYFHVQFATPKRMTPDGEARLVPQDGQASHVCRRVADPRGVAGPPGGVPGATPAVEQRTDTPPGAQPAQARQPTPVEGVEFVGRLHGKDEAKFILIYSTERRGTVFDRFGVRPVRGQPRMSWAEAQVTLDLRKAVKVGLPAEARERRATREAKEAKKKTPQWPVRDDLEGLWAVAQTDEFGRLQNEISEFGFYGFAFHAAGRKYHVPVRPEQSWNRGGIPDRGRSGRLINEELYETTTGATAVAESLQLQRMLNTSARDMGKRTVAIDKIEGINIAEHPWDKMMGDKKPAPEPMAKLIPDDNVSPAKAPTPEEDGGGPQAEQRQGDREEVRCPQPQREPPGGTRGRRQFGSGVGDWQNREFFNRAVGKRGHLIHEKNSESAFQNGVVAEGAIGYPAHGLVGHSQHQGQDALSCKARTQPCNDPWRPEEAFGFVQGGLCQQSPSGFCRR